MKQQCGPVIPSRRSSRLIDSGKTVLENAQDFKREWNLEDNAGISKNPFKSHVVSKKLLIYVAKDIGIGIEDGNPILDKRVDLDSIRIADMQAKCSHSGCSSNTLDTGLCSQAQLEKPDNRTSTP